MNASSDWDQCDHCGKMVHISELNEDGLCPTCSADDSVTARYEQDRRAWDEDERDMARIKREWDAYDRDPPF